MRAISENIYEIAYMLEHVSAASQSRPSLCNACYCAVTNAVASQTDVGLPMVGSAAAHLFDAFDHAMKLRACRSRHACSQPRIQPASHTVAFGAIRCRPFPHHGSAGSTIFVSGVLPPSPPLQGATGGSF